MQNVFPLVTYSMGWEPPAQLISVTECLHQLKADSCEWAEPPPRLASNSLTTVMPINLMTLWLFWIFISPCWTPSICYSMCCRWLWGGEHFFFFFFFAQQHSLTKCTQASSAIRNVQRPPLLTRLLLLLCLFSSPCSVCIVLPFCLDFR